MLQVSIIEVAKCILSIETFEPRRGKQNASHSQHKLVQTDNAGLRGNIEQIGKGT